MVQWANQVLRLAKAITVAEGSNPSWNNPGDLTESLGFPTCGVANSEGVLKFVNKEDGEYVLCHQVYLMLTGKSHAYKLTDSLYSVGMKYADKSPDWTKNVAAYLGVPESTTLAELAGE